MTRRHLILIVFVMLLISLILSDGCAQAVPLSTPPTTINSIIPAVPPSNIHEQSAIETATATIPEITVQDAIKLIQNNRDNPDFVIIDVRTADEFKSGHLANAVNIDYYSPDFKSNINKLDRNKEYLIYCQTGIRGAAATQIMMDLSFTRLHNLSGGIVQWIDAGFPTVK
jgi:rhodanese-related sulfurtransferase